MDEQTIAAIVLGDLRVDLHERRVSRGAEALGVTSRSFELLRFLIERYPVLASSREIMAGVWPDSIVSADALTQRVKLLRRQLGGAADRYVVCVHGQGYRLALAPVRETGTGAVPSAAAPGVSSVAGQRGWRGPSRPLLAGAIAALLVLAIAAGTLAFYDPPHALKHALKHHLAGGNEHQPGR